MPTENNLPLNELEAAAADAAGAEKPSRTAKDLEAVYDIPVQVSAVLGRATMQVSQLLKLGRGAVVGLLLRRQADPGVSYIKRIIHCGIAENV